MDGQVAQARIFQGISTRSPPLARARFPFLVSHLLVSRKCVEMKRALARIHKVKKPTESQTGLKNVQNRHAATKAKRLTDHDLTLPALKEGNVQHHRKATIPTLVSPSAEKNRLIPAASLSTTLLEPILPGIALLYLRMDTA